MNLKQETHFSELLMSLVKLNKQQHFKGDKNVI